MLTRFRRWVFRSPTIKTICSLVLSVTGGLFTSILAAEIHTSNGIVWSAIHTKSSFWLLMGVFFVTVVFHRAMHSHESSIIAFQDEEFCLAYARSELIPAQVAAAKKEIDNGKVEQFEVAMEKIKRALK